LKEGAQIDALNNKGQTPLCIAAESSHRFSARTVDALVKLGANVNHERPNKKGVQTSLLGLTFEMAFNTDDLWRNVGALIAAGANLNVWFYKDKRHLSLLHWACMTDSVPSYIMAALLRHGADTLAQDVQGKTPLHFLVKKILKFNRIESFVRNISTATLQAACNAPDFEGLTPMHILGHPLSSYKETAKKAFMLFVRIAGANIELLDMKGRTAVAVIDGHMDDNDDEPFIIEVHSLVAKNPNHIKYAEEQRAAVSNSILKKLFPDL